MRLRCFWMSHPTFNSDSMVRPSLICLIIYFKQNLYFFISFFLLQVFGKAVLQCLGCILPFLDKDLIDNIPYLVASSISVLPPSLHQDIINSLCFFILPFTITRQSSYDDQECHSCQSVSAVIMLVFQYSNNPAHHCQLLECLMTLKQNVVKDLLCIIAYGTALSRSSAAKLLFYYWPAFNANLFDRRGLLFKFTSKQFKFKFFQNSLKIIIIIFCF